MFDKNLTQCYSKAVLGNKRKRGKQGGKSSAHQRVVISLRKNKEDYKCSR